MSKRVITTIEELEALPFGSVLLDSRGISLHNNRFFGWTSSNLDRDISRELLERDGLPATVLHEPDAAA